MLKFDCSIFHQNLSFLFLTSFEEKILLLVIFYIFIKQTLFFLDTEDKFDHSTQQIKQMCDDNEFVDMDLNQLGKYQTLSFKDDHVR